MFISQKGTRDVQGLPLYFWWHACKNSTVLIWFREEKMSGWGMPIIAWTHGTIRASGVQEDAGNHTAFSKGRFPTMASEPQICWAAPMCDCSCTISTVFHCFFWTSLCLHFVAFSLPWTKKHLLIRPLSAAAALHILKMPRKSMEVFPRSLPWSHEPIP